MKNLTFKVISFCKLAQAYHPEHQHFDPVKHHCSFLSLNFLATFFYKLKSPLKRSISPAKIMQTCLFLKFALCFLGSFDGVEKKSVTPHFKYVRKIHKAGVDYVQISRCFGDWRRQRCIGNDYLLTRGVDVNKRTVTTHAFSLV